MAGKRTSFFPWKKALRGTFIILLVSLIVLALLTTIAHFASPEGHEWIFLLVWGIIFNVLLLGYWISLLVRADREKKRK
jgi:predicted Na+-dependent transporter